MFSAEKISKKHPEKIEKKSGIFWIFIFRWTKLLSD